MPALEIGIQPVIDPEIETAVLIFCDDAAAELGGALIPFGAHNRAVLDLPTGVEDLIVRRALEAAERLAIEKQLPTLLDLFLCQCVRLGLFAGYRTARYGYQGEDDRISPKALFVFLHYRTPCVVCTLSNAAEPGNHNMIPIAVGSLKGSI
jgi:hypothetical protein